MPFFVMEEWGLGGRSMKSKSLGKVLGILLLFVCFLFVEDVSAYSFSDEQYNDLTVINMGDDDYRRPTAADVNLSGCAGCKVEIDNQINVSYAGPYQVVYQIKDSSDILLETLARQYYVVNNTPYIKTQTGEGSTKPLVNAVNQNFNMLLICLCIGHKLRLQLFLKLLVRNIAVLLGYNGSCLFTVIFPRSLITVRAFEKLQNIFYILLVIHFASPESNIISAVVLTLRRELSPRLSIR